MKRILGINVGERSSKAQGLVEYAIIIPVVAIVVIAAISLLFPRSKLALFHFTSAGLTTQQAMEQQVVANNEAYVAELRIAEMKKVAKGYAAVWLYLNTEPCPSGTKGITIVTRVVYSNKTWDQGWRPGDQMSGQEFEEKMCVAENLPIGGGVVTSRLAAKVSAWAASSGLAAEVVKEWVEPYLRDLPTLASEIRTIMP